MKYLSRISQGLEQKLQEHLSNVAQVSESAVPEQFKPFAKIAGLLHDLGKYSEKWQRYLRSRVAGNYEKSIPHSVHGAVLAMQLHPNKKDPPAIAYIIAGHHAGLYFRDTLKGSQYKSNADTLEECVANAEIEIPDKIPDIALPKLRREFAIRMLFSVVVDADRLDAQYFGSNQALVRLNIADCDPKFPDFGSSLLPIAKIREDFAGYCLAASGNSKGVFRLTGACGIGKTIASAKFAYQHCLNNNMSGIVYVAPLKTIIEQTANIYRQLFGDNFTLEHHSGYEPDENDEEYKTNTERWDKPIIVTSGVQFYESLFAAKPSKCRKLQGLINKVILIDESQTIPANLVRPVLDVLGSLVTDWECTVVLMSATQPAFNNLGNILLDIVDIIPSNVCKDMFNLLNRVHYQYCPEEWEFTDLINSIKDSKLNQGLIIFNTTTLARNFYNHLSNYFPNCYHLSSRMCPAHRQDVLTKVKGLLKENQPCFLISTQVIEAGVDVDFLTVYRQLAPLDSIIQSAGRCNREGKLGKGKVVIFNMPFQLDLDYKNKAILASNLLEKYDINKDVLEITRKYFCSVFNEDHDGGKVVQALRENYNFPEVAEKFKVLDADQISVVVDYGDCNIILEEIKNQGYLTAKNWRHLQKYTVNAPPSFSYFKEICGIKLWDGAYDDCGLRA